MSRMMHTLLGIGAIPAVFFWGAAAARAQHIFGHHSHCPPNINHCQERPPRIHITRGCPKPVCNPGDNPNWGYYEPCWSPWPGSPDRGHCRPPSPAAAAPPTTESPLVLRQAPTPPAPPAPNPAAGNRAPLGSGELPRVGRQGL
jgi:hypothetical protein